MAITTPTPFPHLTARDLRGAYGWLAKRGVKSLELEHPEGGTLTLRLRDVLFIHDLNAGRFGPLVTCPVCADGSPSPDYEE